jgi:hypothetical protein
MLSTLKLALACFGMLGLLFAASTASATVTVDTGSVSQAAGGTLTLGNSSGASTLVLQSGSGGINIGDGNMAVTVTSNVTRLTGATGSYQNLAADLTLQGNAGGPGHFQAGVMGNVHGSGLTQAGNETAGVIGAYSIQGSNSSTYTQAAVIGDVGSDGASSTANGAFMAVINGGDPGELVTANAAYGVDYLNGTVGSHFNYGIDLSHAAHDAYPAVSYGIADVRLSNGTRIYTGSAATRAAVRAQVGDSAPIGSLYVGSTAVGTTKPNLYVKVLNAGANTDWERIVTQASD